MNTNLWLQLMAAILPALITGIGGSLITFKKCKNEIKTLKISNKHDIERLIKQHEIDIENLEKAHTLKMKEMRANSENETANILIKEIFSSPSVKEEFNKKIREEFSKNK